MEGAVLVPVESQTSDDNELISLHKDISCCREASSVEVVISSTGDERIMEVTEHNNRRYDRRQEVLKSMVACGLTESTTSLSIVTAAATAQISNGETILSLSKFPTFYTNLLFPTFSLFKLHILYYFAILQRI